MISNSLNASRDYAKLAALITSSQPPKMFERGHWQASIFCFLVVNSRPLCGVLNYAELSSCERVNAKTAGILLAHELCIIITAFLEIVSMRPALDNGQLLPLVPGAWQVRELSWINLPRHTYEWSLDSHGLTTMQRR